MALKGLEAKLKNSESALEFLQDQHQNVLQDLHSEIDQLRRQCQELQFSLATQTSEQLSEAEQRYRRQVGDLQRHLRTQTESAQRLETVRSQQADTIAALQQQVKWTQLQLDNEGDARAQTARHLRAEISERDDAIRHLTAQLHEAQSQGARLRRQSRPRNAVTVSVGVQTEPERLARQQSQPERLARQQSQPERLARRQSQPAARVGSSGAAPAAGTPRGAPQPVRARRRPSDAVSLPPIELNQSVGVAGGRSLIRQQLRLRDEVAPAGLAVDRPAPGVVHQPRHCSSSDSV